MLSLVSSSSNKCCQYHRRHPINIVIMIIVIQSILSLWSSSSNQCCHYHHRHPINVVIIIIVIQSMLSLSSSSSNKCWHGSETGSPVTGRTWCCVPEQVRASGPASSSWPHLAAVRAGQRSWYPRPSIPSTQPAWPSTTWSRSIFVCFCITMKKNNGMLVFGVRQPPCLEMTNQVSCSHQPTNEAKTCDFTVDHRRLYIAVVECSISPC